VDWSPTPRKLCSLNALLLPYLQEGNTISMDLRPKFSFAPLLLQSPISSFGCKVLQIPSIDLEATIAKTFARSKLQLFLS
ncbi:unnamed protein product, partial [Brassica oleracea]